MQTGKYVFRFNNLAPRRPVHLLFPANGDSVFNIRTTQFRWTSAADMQADPHYYVFSIYGPNVSYSLTVNDTIFRSVSLTGFQANSIYTWRVTTRDEFNRTGSVDTFQFVYQPPVTGVHNQPSVPLEYGLNQNYPNPFNPATTITYVLPEAGLVTLKIYNTLGEEVARLVNGREIAGRHTISFDASRLASGLYYYRLATPNFTDVKKMVLIK